MTTRTLAWPLALVVAAAALASSFVARPAGAQSAPRGWEYRVFRVDPADYSDKADYREILRANNNDGLRAEAPFQEHVLSYLGREGWELVQVERPRPGLVYFYMKRPAR